MQLAATDSVREIEVMDLAVKDKCSALRSLAAIISSLDKIIPSPLIFRVFDEEGAGAQDSVQPQGVRRRGTTALNR